jgi:hypothetical protein
MPSRIVNQWQDEQNFPKRERKQTTTALLFHKSSQIETRGKRNLHTFNTLQTPLLAKIKP